MSCCSGCVQGKSWPPVFQFSVAGVLIPTRVRGKTSTAPGDCDTSATQEGRSQDATFAPLQHATSLKRSPGAAPEKCAHPRGHNPPMSTPITRADICHCVASVCRRGRKKRHSELILANAPTDAFEARQLLVTVAPRRAQEASGRAFTRPAGPAGSHILHQRRAANLLP